MSPYPPGTSASDPRAPWNEPDHSHEHAWSPVNDGSIIEDGAAIFHEECLYVEGRYGEGWECEETRTYRFEYSTLVKPDGTELPVHDITDWESNSKFVQDMVEQIEERFVSHGPGGEVEIDVDPDPECGVVSIEWNDWELRYEP
jgi:hypothetical protein